MQQAISLELSSTLRVGFVVAVVALAVALVRSASVAPATTARAPAVVAQPTAAQPAVATLSPAAPAATAKPGVFSLSLSDVELTRAAATAFPQTVSGVTVSDPVVRVQPNGVRLVARAKVLFGSTQFVMLATPVLSDGRLVVRVDSATVAGIAVPDQTKTQIAETMRATVARLIPGEVRLTSVTLTTGSVTVTGAS